MLNVTRLLVLLTMIVTFQAFAVEIYKCKGEKNKLIYQQKPCTGVGDKLGNFREMTMEEQAVALEKKRKFSETRRLEQEEYALKRNEQELKRKEQEKEWEVERKLEEERVKKSILEQEYRRRQQESLAIERQKIELLERQTRAMDDAARAGNQSRSLHCIPDYAGGLNCN